VVCVCVRVNAGKKRLYIEVAGFEPASYS
jgi:hypothetical protein